MDDDFRTHLDTGDEGIARQVLHDLSDVRPACTGVVVAALLDPRWKVEIEVDAVVVD